MRVIGLGKGGKLSVRSLNLALEANASEVKLKAGNGFGGFG
jgi:hypothetical protein